MYVATLIPQNEELTAARHSGAVEAYEQRRTQARDTLVAGLQALGRTLPSADGLESAVDELVGPAPQAVPFYEVDPDVVYPHVLDRIAEALAGGVVPPTIRELYLGKAQALPVEAWALAATPRDEMSDEPALLKLRAQALDIVRLWTLELHHAAIGHAQRGIRIVKRPAWRD